MSREGLQLLCAAVAAPSVSAPLRVLKLGPASDGDLAEDFATAHLLPVLQVRSIAISLEEPQNRMQELVGY